MGHREAAGSHVWKTVLARVRKAWSSQSRGSYTRVRVVTWVLLACVTLL